MKNIKVNFWKVFFPMLIVLLLAINLLTNNTIAQTKNSYKVIEVKNQITEGKDKEVNMLFEGERRKIAQLTLRNEANLRWHSVAEPITIHCIVGEGELLICLERELTNELIKAMAERKPIRIICLDEGFQNNDQLKTNAALIMKTKGVVKFQTV